MATTRRAGVSLNDIREEFSISHRTAQRMTEALEAVFLNVEAFAGPDRRRRWRIADPVIEKLQLRQETAVEALEIASRTAHSDGRLRHATALDDVRRGLLARLTSKDATRTEADVEAVLLGMGSVARPGPRQPERGDEMRNFRMDRIRSAQCLDESFNIASGFSLEDYIARSFGVYQNPKQYDEVIWRFASHAAARAAEFSFHPKQIVEPQDGSLIVRFHAAGWLEMAWHLYSWGDAVEVVAPKGLRNFIENHRRTDFDSLP